MWKFVIISVWILELCPKMCFCEVTLTFYHQNLISSSLSPNRRLCNFNEIPLRRSWYIAFTRMGRRTLEKLKKLCLHPPRLSPVQRHKNIQISNWKVEHQMKMPSWTLGPHFFFSTLCPPTAWMLSVNVWTWTWPTRNRLTALTKQVMLQRWSRSSQKLEQQLFFLTEVCISLTPHLNQSAINHKLLHALCKVLNCAHKPCCSCKDCQCFLYLYSSHRPIASVLFSWVSESLCVSDDTNYFAQT